MGGRSLADMCKNASRVVYRVKYVRRQEQIAAEVQLQNWVNSHTAATREQQWSLMLGLEPVATGLMQVPSVDMVMLVYEPNADMISQHAAAQSSVRKPDTNLQNMLDDWAFKTRIAICDASPPIVAPPKPKSNRSQINRHAGKLALHMRQWRSYGVGDEEQFTARHEIRSRYRLRREGACWQTGGSWQ